MTTKRKPTKRRGGDDLTDRERGFVKERRADPIAPNWEVAERAGYVGTKQRLGERARKLLAEPKIALAVYGRVAAKELAKQFGVGFVRQRVLAVPGSLTGVQIDVLEIELTATLT